MGKYITVGDFGKDTPEELAVSKLVAQENPDLVILLGDNNYPDGASGTIINNIKKHYGNWIYNPTAPSGQVCTGKAATAQKNMALSCPGNHDWHASGLAPYLNFFTLPTNPSGTERYFDTVIDNIHWFSLDSDSAEPDGVTASSKQALWLKDRLSKSTSQWKIVFFHHTAYCSSPKHGSAKSLQWPYEAWGADLVLAGHNHMYERVRVGKTFFVTNGLGGNEIYPTGSPISGSILQYNGLQGYQKLDVTDTEIRSRFINTNGVVIDDFTITKGVVANHPPIVNAGGAQVITLPVNNVTLNGSATDSDGTISSYKWTQISGPTSATIVSSTSKLTDITNLSQGVYIFRLTATDNLAASGYGDVSITVNPPISTTPTVNAGADIKTTSTTIHPIGTIIDTYNVVTTKLWTKISGGNAVITGADTLTPTISGLAIGSYVFRLEVMDKSNELISDDINVMIDPIIINPPPVALAGLDQLIQIKGNFTKLDASASTDDGSITSYQWVQISGPSCNILTPNTVSTIVTGLIQGVYTFEVNITDNSGNKSKDQIVLTVKDDGVIIIPPPISDAKITSFILVNSGTEKDVRGVKDGDILSIKELGFTKCNIRVQTTNTTSVKFELSGTQSLLAIDSPSPFSIQGDNGLGNFFYGKWNPPAFGPYTLKATPSNTNGEGVSSTINFSFVA